MPVGRFHPRLSVLSGLLWLVGLGTGCHKETALAPDSGYYEGKLPDGQAVWLRWRHEDDEVTGDLRSSAATEPTFLKGTNTANGFVGCLTDTKDPRIVPTKAGQASAWFQLQPVAGGRQLKGYWLPAGTNRAQPVCFERFADMAQRQRTASLRFGRFGRTHEAWVAWPRLAANDPLASTVNPWLDREVNRRLAEFNRWDAQDLKEMWTWPEFSGHQDFSDGQWEVVWHGHGVFSLLETYQRRRGGIPFNDGWRSANFRLSGAKGKELRLADFFQAQSPWKANLSLLVRTNLARQHASGADETAVEPSEERAFTFNPSGLQIYFNAGEAGRVEEGPFTVHLAWASLAPYLVTNGSVPFPDDRPDPEFSHRTR